MLILLGLNIRMVNRQGTKLGEALASLSGTVKRVRKKGLIRCLVREELFLSHPAPSLLAGQLAPWSPRWTLTGVEPRSEHLQRLCPELSAVLKLSRPPHSPSPV